MINYFEAAEKTLRARGLLETALGNLERKKERILRYGAPSEYPSADMSKPYTGAKSVNDALADCLELAEVMREIQVTRDKVEEIDDVLAQMDEADARILRLWYIERKSKEEILASLPESTENMSWWRILVPLLVLVALIGVAGLRLYRTMFVTARMPDLFGLDEATAQRMVSNAGLTLKTEYAYSDQAEGYVFDQTPEANAEVRRGGTVTAMISEGTGLLLMPRLTGMAVEDAENVLLAQGLSLGYVETVPSEKLRGVVLEQSPEAGTNAEPGAVVALTVSGGRVVVPALVGQREEEAVERMNAIGLICGDIGYQNVETARQDGVVLAQSIDKFTEVLPGSVVNMTVGRYDRRRYTAGVTVTVDVPQSGVTVRVTLVDENGQESYMFAATYNEEGRLELHVTLRSETSGVRTWRLYLDGNFKSEATAVLQ